jgi:hypothetical protein
MPTRLIAKPVNIASLKNGKHSICINKERRDLKDEGQRCFSFVKQGDHIKGAYQFSMDRQAICIDGYLHNNLVTGSAEDRHFNREYNIMYSVLTLQELEEKRRDLPKSKPIAFDDYLQAARGKLAIIPVNDKNADRGYYYTAKITYAKIRLDLNNFQQISSHEHQLNECTNI